MKKETNFKNIIIKETETEIIGFCPQCGTRIFTERKDKPFEGDFHFCFKCGIELEPFPPKPPKPEDKKKGGAITNA